MAFNLKGLTGEVRPRYASDTLSDELVAKDKIAEEKLKYVNKGFNVLDDLGIVLDQNGKPPVNNGVSSMFILKRMRAETRRW